MWQPIETAPKDGTTILGWFPEFNQPCQFTHWWDEKTVRYGKVTDERSEWFVGGVIHFGEKKEYKPSHWMPLPAPPSQEK